MKISSGFRFIKKPKQIVKAIVEKAHDTSESVVEHVADVILPAADTMSDKLTDSAEAAFDKLESTRSVGIFVTTGKKFFKINGIDLAGLLTLEFFTTLIPIMILGASGLSGFNQKFNIGDAIVNRLGLTGNAAKTIHDAFPAASDLKSFYSFFGLLSFLIWGIPLAIQVGRIFASAYNSRRFTLGSEIFRGIVWFTLFLVTLSVSNIFPSDESLALRALDFIARFAAVYLFWVFTPALLVRDGIAGIKFLMLVGFAGAIVDALILPILFKYTIPILLNSWEGFGSIGIAMTIATWCAVKSTGWVLIACFGGEMAKHNILAKLRKE